jgi:hypothetical protein
MQLLFLYHNSKLGILTKPNKLLMQLDVKLNCISEDIIIYEHQS